MVISTAFDTLAWMKIWELWHFGCIAEALAIKELHDTMQEVVTIATLWPKNGHDIRTIRTEREND